MFAASVLEIAVVVALALLGASFVLAVGARLGRAVGDHATAGAFANRAPPAIEGPTATIAFLGDVQRGIRDVAGPLAAALRAERVALLVSSGDLASHGEAPYYGVVARALDAAGLALPMLVVPGNHDLHPRGTRDGGPGRALFERAIGPRRWEARVGDLRIVGLDDAIAPPDVEETPWLAERLASWPSSPYLLVCHKPPRRLDLEGAPVLPGAGGLVALLEARPPVAVVSGHLREDAEATIRGVHYVVNVRGGDYEKKRWFPPPEFRLVLCDVGASGTIAFRRIDVRRRASAATAWHQLIVRAWAESRRGVGRIVGWPADTALRLLGWR